MQWIQNISFKLFVATFSDFDLLPTKEKEFGVIKLPTPTTS
jgi:hypothetical protein